MHLCREYPTLNGLIENVLLGDEGEISLVEARLWQNPDARRKVVGQLIDYASCVKGTPYPEFEKNINLLRKRTNLYSKQIKDRSKQRN